MSAKTYAEEEIREIAARQGLSAYPHLALMREKLPVKAKNEPEFRFYNLKRLVVETETLRCAWHLARANKGAPGVDGVVKRLNLILDGWGRYFRCGYPARQFAKVSHYVRQRLYRFLNRKSQRKYRMKYAETYYGNIRNSD